MAQVRERAVVDLPRDRTEPPAITEWAEHQWFLIDAAWRKIRPGPIHERFAEYIRQTVGGEEIRKRFDCPTEPAAFRPMAGMFSMYCLQRNRRESGTTGGIWEVITWQDVWAEFCEDGCRVHAFLEREYEEAIAAPEPEVLDV